MRNNDAVTAQLGAAGPKGSAAIEVAHLVKFYKTTRAVDDVTFRIARGSITGLLGGNGAGKTTTIAMIMGLVLPTAGRVQVLGHPMPDESHAVLGRMNFESPYVDMPMRLTVLGVERRCDRVIIMKRGRIEDDDAPERIMARYNRDTLEEVFLDVARGRDRERAT